MASRDARGCEGFWKIRLDPFGELRLRLSVSHDDILEPPLGLRRVISLEDAAEIGRDFRLHGHLWDVGHCILYGLTLASLPRHTGEHGIPGGTTAGMVIAGDGRRSEDTPTRERFEKLSPVDLGFTQGDATTDLRPVVGEGLEAACLVIQGVGDVCEAFPGGDSDSVEEVGQEVGQTVLGHL